jgi:hypothetical protein
MGRIGRSRDRLFLGSDANAGAIAASGFRRFAILLHQHGVIDIVAKSSLYRSEV